MKIYEYLKNPKRLLIALGSRNIIKIEDEKFLELLFEERMKKSLNINAPVTFSEKIQWLKLYDRNHKYIDLTDKYKVKDIIKEKLGEEYIIPTLGVWERVQDINFEKLPNQFVLKCNHDSGGVVICKDKNEFDVKKAKKKLSKCLKRNYYYSAREWPYKNIRPLIIAEKFVEDDFQKELLDYKFMCFNGKVKCSFICSERENGNLKVDFYDLEWNKMPFERKYSNSETKFKKPRNYELMIKLAEKLAKDIPFVRVDFYEINGKVYFGELTFYPGSGMEEFRPEEYDKILGDMIILPKEKRGEI